MLTPAPSPGRFRAVGRIATVLAVALALSSGMLAILTHSHPGIHPSAEGLPGELRPGPVGAAGPAAGMDPSESSSDPRRSGSGTP